MLCKKFSMKYCTVTYPIVMHLITKSAWVFTQVWNMELDDRRRRRPTKKLYICVTTKYTIRMYKKTYTKAYHQHLWFDAVAASSRVHHRYAIIILLLLRYESVNNKCIYFRIADLITHHIIICSNYPHLFVYIQFAKCF